MMAIRSARGLSVLAAVSIVGGLDGCAAQSSGDVSLPNGNDCFWARAIHDWRPLNDRSLIVWSPSRSCPYLVEFVMRCEGLRSTEDIRFDDRDGLICPFGGDAVIVPGRGGERCTITSVRRLTPQQLDAMLGRDTPAGENSTPPGECKGYPESAGN